VSPNYLSVSVGRRHRQLYRWKTEPTGDGYERYPTLEQMAKLLSGKIEYDEFSRLLPATRWTKKGASKRVSPPPFLPLIQPPPPGGGPSAERYRSEPLPRPLLLGRSPRRDLTLEHPAVALHHLTIERALRSRPLLGREVDVDECRSAWKNPGSTPGCRAATRLSSAEVHPLGDRRPTARRCSRR